MVKEKDETLEIDGNIFIEIDNGFYKARKPYVVEKRNWVINPLHNNMSALCSVKDNTYSILFLSTTTSGSEQLYDLYADYKSKNQNYSVLSGVSETPGTMSIGDFWL